jgi:DNA topoisomerase-1
MKDYIVRTIKRKHANHYTYEYKDKRGKRLSVRETQKHTKGLYVPPAHDNVKINLKKKEKVLAIGYDTKGRAQYVYNPTFKDEKQKEKFQKMIQFGESYQKITRQIHKDLYTEGDSKEKQIAIILRLVTDCCFRIGNDKYAKENKSYGVTTIQNSHVKVKGQDVTIDFIGKKGVRNICTVKNKKVRKELRTKKRCLRKDDKLFMYRKGNCYHYVKSGDVNTYLKKFGDFSVKDFRTWIANLEVISQLMKTDVTRDTTETEKKQMINASLDKVAHKLHNTRSVCKSNYVDPFVLETFMSDTDRFRKTFHSCTTKEEITRHYISLLRTNT